MTGLLHESTLQKTENWEQSVASKKRCPPLLLSLSYFLSIPLSASARALDCKATQPIVGNHLLPIIADNERVPPGNLLPPTLAAHTQTKVNTSDKEGSECGARIWSGPERLKFQPHTQKKGGQRGELRGMKH